MLRPPIVGNTHCFLKPADMLDEPASAGVGRVTGSAIARRRGSGSQVVPFPADPSAGLGHRWCHFRRLSQVVPLSRVVP